MNKSEPSDAPWIEGDLIAKVMAESNCKEDDFALYPYWRTVEGRRWQYRAFLHAWRECGRTGNGMDIVA